MTTKTETLESSSRNKQINMKTKVLAIAAILAFVVLGLTACQTDSDHGGQAGAGGHSEHSGCH